MFNESRVTMLREKLAQDLKTAMKEKDTIAKDTIQMARSALLQIEKDQKLEITDSIVVDVIVKELKKRADSLDAFTKGGREELVAQTQAEIKVLRNYMPQQLSEDALRVLAMEAIQKTGAASKKELGKVMAELKPLVKSGQTDGKSVQKLLSELLTDA
jgi:uncharacterized protein